ncbi:hypothetical protein AVEN_207357-1 [Araneus ventricosus]|uniref:Tc1-like transposase DDE domain-containing protein n=1 Tax=Araneus ventricosus TaxID=182803 RepID=A0A4Y2VHN9_ARAVE|nr:hypothetical protein AVEN_207357-1 [Araneus ventricosus]
MSLHTAPQIFMTFSIILLLVEQSILLTRLFTLFQKFFQEKKLTVLDWAVNSPNANLIQNLWSIVKRLVSKMDCSTKRRIIEDVIKICFRDDDVKNNLCSKLVGSIPKRVQNIIKARGGHIFY